MVPTEAHVLQRRKYLLSGPVECIKQVRMVLTRGCIKHINCVFFSMNHIFHIMFFLNMFVDFREKKGEKEGEKNIDMRGKH